MSLAEVDGAGLARPGLTRRRVMAAAALLGSGVCTAQAAPATLPRAVSLQHALAQALQQGQPLVVMVSLEGCPFCKVVREHLAPMQRQQGLPVVQVDMRSARTLADFQGLGVSHEVMIRQWGIQIAPTVLFFGRQAQEVAERLAGASIPDFYGAYLDDRLAQARARLR